MQHIFTFHCSSLLCVILLVIKHVSFVMPLKLNFLGVGWFRRVPVLEIKASHPPPTVRDARTMRLEECICCGVLETLLEEMKNSKRQITNGSVISLLA